MEDWRIAVVRGVRKWNDRMAPHLLHFPHFCCAVLAQFPYIGAQLGTWSYFIQHVQEYAHEPEKVAGYFLTG
jgi:fucose permease